MSFDLNLSTTCNHLIFRELARMDDDRHAVRVKKPISSNRTVKVWANDEVVPSSMYTIVGDTETVEILQPKMIQFKEKWRSPRDRFEISYVTLRSYCPKCVGLEVLDDISYTVRGRLKEVRDETLLLQNLEKFVVTEALSNPFHSYIGSSLVTFLGQKISDFDFLTSKITQEINASLTKFMDLQEQYRLTGRIVSDGEILDSVDNIEVLQDGEDPTVLRANVDVRSRAGKSVQFSQELRIAEG